MTFSLKTKEDTKMKNVQHSGTKTYPRCDDNHNIDQEILSEGSIF